MMQMTIAILGRQPKLGLAELEAVFGADKLIPLTDNTVVIDLAWEEVAAAPLGSVVKSAEIIDTLESTDWQKVGRRLTGLAGKAMQKSPEGKITFGLSAIGFRTTPRDIERTGLMIKRDLKQSGRPVRYVQNKQPELSSAAVLHNALTRNENNYEWLIIATREGQSIVARTRYVQDIDAYSDRDFGRPNRDAFVGMLPPKLAQIMINLIRPSIKVTDLKGDDSLRLLDPFCGTGVVLQEAALMGYAIYGTDLSEKMVRYSRDNINWLADKYRIQPKADYQLADAQAHKWSPPIDMVVCEGYLGQPMSQEPPREKLESVMYECNSIMRNFLKNIQTQLEPGTPLCIGMPAWHVKNGIQHLPVLDDLENLGYNRIDFVHADHEDLIYHREDQIVGRELVVLTKE